MQWFRWHVGACEDVKFRIASRNAEVTVAVTLGLWAVLLEDAARDENEGVATRGKQYYGVILDLPDDDLTRILDAMQSAGLIVQKREEIQIVRWGKRQFKKAADNTNAERQRRYREKRNAEVTPLRHGPETETETETEEDSIPSELPDGEQKNGSASEDIAVEEFPDIPADCDRRVNSTDPPDKAVYIEGKRILGKSAGGLIRNLIAAVGGDLDRAAEVLAASKNRESPREYVGAVVSRHGVGKSGAELMAELEAEESAVRNAH